MDSARHVGRMAVVSGAGYGIGRATASRFAREAWAESIADELAPARVRSRAS